MLQGIVFPIEWRGELSAESIRCYKRGKLKQEIERASIETIQINALLDHSSHWIHLKNGRDLRFTKLYFEDHVMLEEALRGLNYPLKTSTKH